MKVRYVSIFTVVLVVLSGIPLLSGGGTNYANAKYATNTQLQGNANDCDNGSNCAINSPQTQGDGTASSPTNLQISETNEEASTTPPPTSGPGPH
ncbi:MAG: hypothetical protein ACRD8W_30805, partial [Nitrososphaeraceae archaeon]